MSVKKKSNLPKGVSAPKAKKKKKPGPKPGTKAFGERSKKRLRASGDKLNKAVKKESTKTLNFLGITGNKQRKKAGDPWVQTVHKNLVGGLADKRLAGTKTEKNYIKTKAAKRKKGKK